MKVAVLGAGGKMGSTVAQTVIAQPDLKLVAVVDPRLSGIEFEHATGVSGSGLSISGDISEIVRSGADVVVDFTTAASAFENLKYCASHGISAVVGTTGLDQTKMDELDRAFIDADRGCIVAANFAIGAILMMRFAEIAAGFFETAEVLEMHHETKIDAPSGTAIATARRIASAKLVGGSSFLPDSTENSLFEGARGADVDGVRVHSMRIRGAIAHQEVVFGTMGQSLSIRHDSYDRSSFMPGLIIAIRGIQSVRGVMAGIDRLIDDRLSIRSERGE
ncbi:MAG: 4-hydroxy-tetrahydrodipicolinate reductase [Acidimicrobiaceae bacterium]|nr:4-hydroxy-tetrahydrodipicolinate reductase [Acidimicrobiaceae bacterium]